jgi:hypothetical protein
VHKLDDLYQCSCSNATYGETPINKYNYFLVDFVSRSSLSNIISGEAHPSSLSSKEIISSSASSKGVRMADIELDYDSAIHKCT